MYIQWISSILCLGVKINHFNKSYLTWLSPIKGRSYNKILSEQLWTLRTSKNSRKIHYTYRWTAKVYECQVRVIM